MTKTSATEPFHQVGNVSHSFMDGIAYICPWEKGLQKDHGLKAKSMEPVTVHLSLFGFYDTHNHIDISKPFSECPLFDFVIKLSNKSFVVYR